MSNMRFYDELRAVPDDAKKKITGGRLNGMTNIQPMWRIRRMTEIFGPCGIGWKIEIVDKRIEDGFEGERVAVVDINAYIKDGDRWSDPIPGTGASPLIAKETKGLRTDDEAYKKAFTDAQSVAFKLLGLAADVYFDNDPTKYDRDDPTAHDVMVIKRRIERLITEKINRGMDMKDILASLKLSEKGLNEILRFADRLNNFEQAVRNL